MQQAKIDRISHALDRVSVLAGTIGVQARHLRLRGFDRLGKHIELESESITQLVNELRGELPPPKDSGASLDPEPEEIPVDPDLGGEGSHPSDPELPISPVEPGPQDPPPIESGTRIGKGTIEWEFRDSELVGRFADGSPYVVGPATVVEITPRFDGQRHGSEIPAPRSNRTALDMRTLMVDHPSWGVPDIRLVQKPPIELDPVENRVLLSARSYAKAASKNDGKEGVQLLEAQILTCLEANPIGPCFRPPYIGNDRRTILLDEVNWNRLQSRPRHPAAPRPADVFADGFNYGPWLLHHANEVGAILHPTRNMPAPYARDFVSIMGTAYLVLHMDFPLEEKKPLAQALIQIGIDAAGIVSRNRSFWYSSPHHIGMKWAIIFAGIMLEDSVIVNTARHWRGVEDQMTYVVETIRQSEGIGPDMLGKFEWGIAHGGPKPRLDQDDGRWLASEPLKPGQTPQDNSVQYRHVVGSAWWAQALCAEIMGARPTWNYEHFFRYMHRFAEENQKRGLVSGDDGWMNAKVRWHYDLWKLWRENA